MRPKKLPLPVSCLTWDTVTDHLPLALLHHHPTDKKRFGAFCFIKQKPSSHTEKRAFTVVVFNDWRPALPVASRGNRFPKPVWTRTR